MDSINSLENICRLCLKMSQDGIPIFADAKKDGIELNEKITLCLPVKISEKDKLPNKICITCSKTVDFIYNFWKIAENSEKQLKNIIRSLRETDTDFLISTSDPKWPHEQTVILDEPSEIETDLVGETNGANIEIKEVFISDYANQNVSNQGMNTVIVQKDNFESFEASIDHIINKPPTVIPDQNLCEKKVNTPKDTQISQIVESSNVALRTFDLGNTFKLKLWDLTLSDVFLIPFNYEEDKIIESNSIVSMNMPNLTASEASAFVELNHFTCTICQISFTEQLPYLKHYESDHKLFKCPFCVRHYDKRYHLESHLMVHSDRRNFTCTCCEMKFKRSSDLRNHVKRMHMHIDENTFKCDHCSYETKHKRLVRAHVLNHIGISLYSCNLCCRSFNTETDLIDHHNSPMGYKPHRCDICGNRFSKKHYMLVHRKQLHEESCSFQCEICGKTFSFMDSLRMHLKLHNEENRAQCDVCSKILSSKKSLKNHKKMHEDFHEFVCGICGKNYFNKHSLQEHVLVHTGSKPFQCLNCDKTFSTRKKVLNHEQIHLEGRVRFNCKHCSKSYLTKFRMKKHTENCKNKFNVM